MCLLLINENVGKSTCGNFKINFINCILCCVLLLLFLFFAGLFFYYTSIVTKFEPTDDNLMINISRALVYNKKGCQLLAFDSVEDGLRFEKVIKSSNESEPKCNFDLYVKDTTFFNTDFLSIKSTSKLYPEIKLPVNYDTVKKNIPLNGYVLALDYIREKIYAVSVNNEYESDKLIVVDFKVRDKNNSSDFSYNVILSNLNSPKNLIVDPSKGKLFFVQHSAIYSLNLDGSELNKIVEQSGISSVVVYNEKRIFWTTDTPVSMIRTMDINGLEPITIRESFNRMSSLTRIDDKIYWRERISHDNYSLLCLEINDSDHKKYNECKQNFQQFNLNKDEAEVLRGYNFISIASEKLSNDDSCTVNNGNCHHMCLANRSGFSCRCKLGYRLMEDNQSCDKGPFDSLIYARDKYVGKRFLDAIEYQPFAEIIHPVRISKYPIISFDILNNNIVYATDGQYLYNKILDIDCQGIEIYHPGAKSIAVDQAAKNVYVAKSNEIRVFPSTFKSLRESKTLLTIQDPKIEIASLSIDSNHGLVFFTQHNSSSGRTRIYKMSSDGSKVVKVCNKLRVKNASSLAIYDNKLYWFGIDEKTIESTKINNPDCKVYCIKQSLSKNLKTIVVQDKWMYVSTPDKIYRLNEKNGSVNNILYSNLGQNLYPIADQKIFTANSVLVSSDHPCTNSPHCQTFCFVLKNNDTENNLNRKCGCYDGETLQLDNMTCA